MHTIKKLYIKLLKKGKLVRHYIEYLFVKFFFTVFSKMKVSTASNACGAISKFVTKTICLINGRHETAIKNLTLCFPEKTDLQKEQIMDKFYENVGRFIGEYINQSKMDAKWFAENVEVVNPEILEEYSAEGFFGITAHFGNWELIHKYFSLQGKPLNIIYRRQNNEFIEKKFIDNRPVNQIPKNVNSMRQLMGLIKGKKIIGILIDQRDNTGERFPFFGRGARTGVAIQRLSLKYNYPMVCVKVVRKIEDPNKFKIIFYKPLQVKNTGDIEEDTKMLTQKTLDMVQGWVEENPDQWFWMYDRWK